MISKIVAYLLLYYFVYKTSLPPNPSPKLTKIKKTSFSEILLVYFLPYPFIILWSLCTLCYFYIMYHQENNNIVIINDRFSEWSFYDLVFYILNIIGCLIRLWSLCFIDSPFIYWSYFNDT
ncbi:hypothetical protein GLOIN_2v384542 [Rhizophagus clarus]|uniref:Uncharacterized protein n=1 Tax=Rhizophagus clarus TaxID=94130 RepID=A0A8H3L7J0_9GLOM|nr:hypothetical protein GLOIN_2v384542 [Rhizophagus clarus]